MTTFARALATYGALLLVLSAPVVVMARRRRHDSVARGFTWAAVGLSVFCAVLVTGSDQLVTRCREAGNTQCHDYGNTGFVLLLVGGFGLAAIVKAIMIAQE